MTPQCGKSVVQVLAVRVDKGIVNYEAMTPQCLRSVVRVFVGSVDIAVVSNETMAPQFGGSIFHIDNMLIFIHCKNISLQKYLQIRCVQEYTQT